MLRPSESRLTSRSEALPCITQLSSVGRAADGCGVHAKDLANQIRYSVSYKEAIARKNMKPGSFLSPAAGEFFSGLPLGWTSPVEGAVSSDVMKAWTDANKADK